MAMFDHSMNFLPSSLLLLLLLLPFCMSIDTISSTRPVRDGDLLVSSGESFALGFFSLNNSTNRYVGIWYNKVSERTIVWVANRDSPVSNSSGILYVDDTGNLVLRDGDRNAVVWSTNVSAMATGGNLSRSCQLLDSGNLVLFGGEREGVSAWQSFDYPTNTMLPNMKIGWDRRSGLNRFLTSWKSDNDPGTGDYSYKMDFVGSPQLFLYQGTTPIWRAGTWTGHGWSGVPDMTPNFIFNVSYVDNNDEVTVVWGLHNSSIISRMIVSGSGNIQRLTWNEGDSRWVDFWSAPKDKCDNYNHCGTFGNCDPSATGVFECSCLRGFEPKSSREWYLRDGSSGCTRMSGAHTCTNGEGFEKMDRMKVPDTTTARVDMSVGTLKACEETCLRNCSCVAYASANISDGGRGCIRWYGDMIDTRQFPDGGQDLYLRVDAAELDKDKAALLDWGRRFQIILGIVRGLLYLHQDSRFRIIHRDLKSSNVLLDAALNPKISDFGMARLFGGDQVEDKTHRVVGTYGYMSPEYAMEGLFSIKSDVFSLGVLLLEIVSGRKNSSYYQDESLNLIGHVWELWREGNTLDIVDSSMGDSYEAHEVKRCIHVSLLCVQELAADRPTMSEVAFMLCNETKLQPPLQPAFVFKKSKHGPDSGSSSLGTVSVNEATITVVEGR